MAWQWRHAPGWTGREIFFTTNHAPGWIAGPVANTIDQLIIRVGERLGGTSIAVTHDMRSARRIGRRIVLLHEGRIHVSGTPEEIFSSTDPVVSRFVQGISDLREAPIQP